MPPALHPLYVAAQPHRAEAPHRASEFSEVCGECRELASGTCRRCERPLCSDHVPADDRRCAACEAQFAAVARSADSEVERVKSALAVAALGLLAFAIIAAAAVALVDSLAVLLMVAIILGVPLAHVLGGPISRAVKARREHVEKRRLRALRRHFLVERVPLAPLPPSREEP